MMITINRGSMTSLTSGDIAHPSELSLYWAVKLIHHFRKNTSPSETTARMPALKGIIEGTIYCGSEVGERGGANIGE